MGSYRFDPCESCCGCEILSDDFEREQLNRDEDFPDYEISSGDWAIDDGQLVLSSATGKLLLRESLSLPKSYSVEIDAQLTRAGQSFRIYFADDGAGGGYYAQFDVGEWDDDSETSNGTISLYGPAGLIDSRSSDLLEASAAYEHEVTLWTCLWETDAAAELPAAERPKYVRVGVTAGGTLETFQVDPMTAADFDDLERVAITAATGATAEVCYLDDLGIDKRVQDDCERCPHGCTTCPDPQDEYTLDLGVGGWTDVDCGQCTAIAGEYVVTYEGDDACLWTYEVEEYCWNADLEEWLRLWVGLKLWDYGDTQVWQAYVQLDYGALGSDLSSAIYTSAASEETDDCHALAVDGVITLSKTSEEHSAFSPACAGTLPATIDLLVDG